MEHRLGTRRAVRAAVVLHPRLGDSLRTHTREVSISGMFVEAPAAHIAPHEVLDIEMTLPVTAGLHTFRWQAMVIRMTPEGIGLTFDRLRPPAVTRLLANLDAGLTSTPVLPAAPPNVIPLNKSAERPVAPPA